MPLSFFNLVLIIVNVIPFSARNVVSDGDTRTDLISDVMFININAFLIKKSSSLYISVASYSAVCTSPMMIHLVCP